MRPGDRLRWWGWVFHFRNHPFKAAGAIETCAITARHNSRNHPEDNDDDKKAQCGRKCMEKRHAGTCIGSFNFASHCKTRLKLPLQRVPAPPDKFMVETSSEQGQHIVHTSTPSTQLNMPLIQTSWLRNAPVSAGHPSASGQWHLTKAAMQEMSAWRNIIYVNILQKLTLHKFSTNRPFF